MKIALIYHREEENYAKKLRQHLRMLKNQVPELEVWSMEQLGFGNISDLLQKEIENTDRVLYLLSVDALEDDHLREVLITAQQRGTTVIPILIRSCLYKQEPLVANLVVLPREGYFIHGRNNIDEIFMQIVADVSNSLGGSPKKKTKSEALRTELDEKTRVEPPKPEPKNSRKEFAAALFLLFLFGSSGVYWWWNNGNTEVTPPSQKGPQIEMVEVQGGRYTMGCTSEQEGDCYKDWEEPPHIVQVPSFKMGKYEVTQAQWQAVMGNNPSHFKNCPQCPVEKVSWDDTQDFIRELNAQTGKRYRLPTEAEWEYAAREGKNSQGYKYAGSNTLDEVAWYGSNSGGKTHPVNSKKPNDLGLYHMSGNVYEWCEDRWHSNYEGAPTDGRAWQSGESRLRVLRGGSWLNLPNSCRVSDRDGSYPDFSISSIGFRLAHSL